MGYWAGLGFSVGLLAASLSGCSNKELLAPTPAAFVPPQNLPPVEGPREVSPSGHLNLLYVTDRAPAQ